MTKPLDGFTLLNTRPKNQAASLSNWAKSQGAEIIECPAITIAPLSPETALDHNIDIGIVVSPQAALLALKALAGLSQQVKILTIGKKTTQLLTQKGIAIQSSAPMENSESLLTLPILEQIKGKRILLFKGEGGRQLLKDQLERRGAEVIERNLYQRNCPTSLPIHCQKLLKKGQKFIILGTSQTSVRHLYELFTGKAKAALEQALWLVLSERIATILYERGIDTVVISQASRLQDDLLNISNIK